MYTEPIYIYIYTDPIYMLSLYVYRSYILPSLYIYIYISIYAGSSNIKLTTFIHDVSWNVLYIYIYIYASINETI